MNYCEKCGTQAQDGVRYCPTCGNELVAAQGAQPRMQQQQWQAAPQNDAEENKVMAILAYIIFFIPLLTGAHKSSPFVRHHANQGTVLFLFALAWGILYSILIGIFTAFLLTPSAILSGAWGVFGLVSMILGLLWLIPAILCLLGIVNAATGKLKTLPVIGKFTIIK